MNIRLLKVIEETTVDGPGFRNSVYCAGCAHHCPGCHNPESWAMDGGEERDVEDVARQLLDDPYSDVTFTGGDPFFQAPAFARLASIIKTRSTKTIWCYTGFTFEAIINEADPSRMSLLQHIDVLVDGPFVQALRDEDALFRGSSNQRLIDIPSSLRQGTPVLWIPDLLADENH